MPRLLPSSCRITWLPVAYNTHTHRSKCQIEKKTQKVVWWTVSLEEKQKLQRANPSFKKTLQPNFFKSTSTNLVPLFCFFNKVKNKNNLKIKKQKNVKMWVRVQSGNLIPSRQRHSSASAPIQARMLLLLFPVCDVTGLLHSV